MVLRIQCVAAMYAVRVFRATEKSSLCPAISPGSEFYVRLVTQDDMRAAFEVWPE